MSKRFGRCYGCRKKVLKGEEVVWPDGYRHHATIACVVLGRKRRAGIRAREVRAKMLRARDVAVLEKVNKMIHCRRIINDPPL